MSNLQVLPAVVSDRVPVFRMLELYQHDLSDVWDQDLNERGEYGYPLERYWQDPSCHAFVFRAAGHYAGVALVDGSVKLGDGGLWMAQFFVLRKYRRRGVGSHAAKQLFDRLRGTWEVGQMPLNRPAQTFWRRVISEYTRGNYVEHDLNDARWHGLIQCFDNS